jgi:hypothetical protein
MLFSVLGCACMLPVAARTAYYCTAALRCVLLLSLPSWLQLRCRLSAVLWELLHVTISTAATDPGAAELRGEERQRHKCQQLSNRPPAAKNSSFGSSEQQQQQSLHCVSLAVLLADA